MNVNRRDFLAGGLLFPVAAATPHAMGFAPALEHPLGRAGEPRIRISLNAYSFNRPLRDGEMTLEDLILFCVEHGFDAVDLTGYYFTGYPDAPTREEIARVKRMAFVMGLEISGTGVRNDFTKPAGAELEAEMELVKRWIGVSAQLGAPNLRVFAGRKVTGDPEWKAAATRVVSSLRTCAAEGAQHGVVLAIQNHAEFISTADQLLSILEKIDSPWVAVNLDIGSFPTSDPYADIARVAPYAVAWQIKEEVGYPGRSEPVDLTRVVSILRETRYRGHILLETLGEGDPRIKVPRFLARLRQALEA